MKILQGWFQSRAIKTFTLGLIVAMFVALASVGSVEAKSRKSSKGRSASRGRSSNSVYTPFGRMPKYRPQLQIGSQG